MQDGERQRKDTDECLALRSRLTVTGAVAGARAWWTRPKASTPSRGQRGPDAGRVGSGTAAPQWHMRGRGRAQDLVGVADTLPIMSLWSSPGRAAEPCPDRPPACV